MRSYVSPPPSEIGRILGKYQGAVEIGHYTSPPLTPRRVDRPLQHVGMLECDGDEFDQLSFACRNGVLVNKEGCRGKQYGMEKKLAVAATYQHHKQLCGGWPSLLSIANEY